MYMYYRYARATRTLRAAATLLALHADELAVPCIKPPEALLLSFSPTHTGLAFLSDVRAVVFVLAEERKARCQNGGDEVECDDDETLIDQTDVLSSLKPGHFII